MSSVSGLSASHRSDARKRAVKAALVGYSHKSAIHYTQSAKRWEGIKDTRYSAKGQYPNYADCSAFVTWCIWNGLYVPYKVRDTVNGQAWKAGYTGTMLSHGKRVIHIANVLTADAVIYGGGNGEHTAIVVEKRNGIPFVVSHGSEAGPFLLPYNYRSDVNCFRRYI